MRLTGRHFEFFPCFLYAINIFNAICPNCPTQNENRKECSRAECARLRSRLHCVTARRVASTRQGVRNLEMGSATVPVAVFGVAPKTVSQTDLSSDDSGATPEPARETRALPPIVHCKMILARRSSPAPSARHICRTKTKIKFQPRRGGIFFDNSPAFQGWDSSRTNIKVPSGTAERASIILI